MQGRMRVVLILSLALVLLVSKSFAAPSLVDAPEVAETPQADEETKSTDDKEDVQLQLAGKSDDDDEPEINHEEVAKEFGLTGTDLEQLYNSWVPTVPDGEDSSFQTFLDWMEENDEPEDEGAVGPGTHYLRSIIKWTGKIRNKANKKAKGQRSIDGEKPQMEKSKIAAEFKLTEAELEDLYEMWVPKVPAGDDASFQAFVNWMKENDKPEDDGAPAIGTHVWRSVVIWTWRIGKAILGNNKKSPRSIDDEQPQMDKSQIAAEFGLAKAELEDLYEMWVPKVPAGEDSTFQAFVNWMQENDEPDDDEDPAVGTHVWRSVAKWTRKILGGFVKNNQNKPTRRPRSVNDEQSQPQTNHGQIAAEFGLTEADLEDLYQLWTQKTPAGEDGSFQAFVQWIKDNYEPVDDGAVGPGTQSWSKFIKWGSGGNWFRKKSKKENIADEVQRSVDDEQSEINEQEIATPDKRQLRGRPLRKKLPPIRRPRPRPRGLDEDQQQSIVNGEESMAARDLQPSFKPAPKSPRNEEAELPKENAEDESLGVNADDFELDETELEKLYLSWVSTVSAGDNSSFPAFINWIKENFEPADGGDLKIRTRFFFPPAVGMFLSIANGFRKAKKRPRSIEEIQMDGNQIAAGNEDAGLLNGNVENESEQLGVVATEFGLTEAELKDLYEMWAAKVPAGDDSSFQAFFEWMDENDEPEDEGAVGPETHLRRAIKWTRRVIKWIEKNTKREYVGEEQQIAEGQRSIDEEEPQINQQEIATPDKRNFAAWWKKFGKMFQRKKPRSLEEDQQQSIVNGNGDAELPKENVEDESLGVNAAAYSGQNLFEAYRKWLKTVGEGKDRTFQKFADLFNIRKPRSLESELSDESKLPDTKKPDGVGTEKKVPVKESESSDTNGGYSCEKNSPCNIENIVNEQFYFATTSTDKFIQCDAWGGCHTLTCDDGLVWDDQIKTCGLRT